MLTAVVSFTLAPSYWQADAIDLLHAEGRALPYTNDSSPNEPFHVHGLEFFGRVADRGSLWSLVITLWFNVPISVVVHCSAIRIQLGVSLAADK